MTLARYMQEKSHPILIDREMLMKLRCRVILANVMDEDPNNQYVRHSPERLARVLLRWYGRVNRMEYPIHV